MVQTRDQARREQSSRLVAPLGVHSPQRGEQPLQTGGGRRPESVDVRDDKVRGGRQSSTARGTHFEYRRGGGGIPRISGNYENLRRNKEGMIPKKCGKTLCQTCDIFVEEEVIVCFSTGKTEKIINDRKCKINCGTDNVVYLLECDKC